MITGWTITALATTTGFGFGGASLASTSAKNLLPGK